MEVIKVSDKKAINLALKTLNDGGVVVCPTDTVYGFLVLAENKKAVKKIFKIKKRPKSKPLAIFVFSMKQAKEIAEINNVQEKILKKYWPGKYTFVLKSKEKDGTIAMRIPKYKFLNNLLKKINKPLAQTSVNISGQPELKKIKEIISVFENQKNQPDLIIDEGNLPKSRPSTIIDLSKDNIKTLRK
jgi:L-threonylcarbamoyladenylate synthase